MANPPNCRIMHETQADILIAGGRNQYTALKPAALPRRQSGTARAAGRLPGVVELARQSTGVVEPGVGSGARPGSLDLPLVTSGALRSRALGSEALELAPSAEVA